MSYSDIVKKSAIAATQSVTIQNNINIVIPEFESRFHKRLKAQFMGEGYSEIEANKMADTQESEVAIGGCLGDL